MMKYFSTLFFLFFFSLSCIAQQITSWQMIYPYPTGLGLNSVYTWSVDSFIIVGVNGVVLKTTDGGQRWAVQDHAGGVINTNLYSVTFPSRLIGFTVGWGGTILKTTDGGDTWFQQTSGTSTILLSVNFLNDSVGFVAGSQFNTNTWKRYWNPVILRTSNGGQSWTNLSFPYSTGISSIAMRDELNGIVVGDSMSIFRTTDGGTSWTRVAYNSSGVNSYRGVQHVEGISYVAVSGIEVSQSTDDGLTWNPLPYPSVAEDVSREQRAISFYDMQHGVTGGKNFCYSTQDSGSTWSPWNLSPVVISGIRMVNATTAYAVGLYGSVFKTTDGGINWEKITSYDGQLIDYVCFADENIGLATGNGLLLRTTDGGNTWNKASLPGITKFWLDDIYFTNRETGYIVGTETVSPGKWVTLYIKTTDAGENWSRLNVQGGTRAPYNRIVFTDSLHGIVVGDSGTSPNWGFSVLRTSDAGATWYQANTPYNGSHQKGRGVSFADSNNGTIVATFSDSSLILHTTNGGTDWTVQNAPNEIVNIMDVLLLDSLNGFCIGSGGGYQRMITTSDGGLNWVNQSDFFGAWSGIPYRIGRLSQDAIVVAGTGCIFYSSDRGTSWVRQSCPIMSPTGLSAVQYGNSWKIFVSGQGIATTTIGNLTAKYWTGSADSSWDNPNNWDPVGVPTSGDSVVIRPNGTSPVIFMPKFQITVAALTIIGAGRLTITDALAQLVVLGDVDIRGTLKIRQGARTRIICGRKWNNKPGSLFKSFGETDEGFVPANSTVYFNGQGNFQGNFYNVTFDTTALMETGGNVVVENKCTILKSLSLRAEDTLFVTSTDPQALFGNGIILTGTIMRFINSETAEQYQFESKSSFVQFENIGTKPTSVAMKVFPETTATDWGDVWEEVQSIIDTANNTISATGVQEFSKWSLGIPRPTGAVPAVNRVYAITTQGGENFAAQLSLRFQPSELVEGTAKDSVRLLRLLGIYATNTMQEKWNMVSVPVERKSIISRLKDSLFSSSSSEAFAFIPSTGYVQKDTLEQGIGYWLKFPSVDTISILGEKRDDAKIAVESGWNMVGTLSSPISTSSVTSEPSGILASDFFGYQSGYLTANTLEPMKAYWVKVSSPGVLTLQASAGIAKQKIPNKQLQKFNLLLVRDASGNSQELYYTVKSRKSIKQLFNEFPPPPPAGGFDVRFKSQHLIEYAEEEKHKVMPLIIQSAVYPVTIRWEPKEKNVSVWIVVDGKEYSLARKDSITIMKLETLVKIKFASSNDNVPKVFALEQNYPNPFNPSTVIRYQLPVDSRVSLKVFNVLGQEVETLVDEIQDAGYVSKEWNVSGIASGVYFYRIEATSVTDNTKSYHQVRKMLLLR